MKRILAVMLLSCAASASAQPIDWSKDCALVPAYNEMSARAVKSVGDYEKLKADFGAVNGSHRTRAMRLPPSLSIPPTDENVAALAADLRKVAHARAAQMAQCK